MSNTDVYFLVLVNFISNIVILIRLTKIIKILDGDN